MAITVLPWRNASELAFVRDCFFPQHTTTPETDIYTLPPASLSEPAALQTRIKYYNLGLQRVRIWNFRSPASVPHAVDATAALVEAIVHDEGAFGGASNVTILDYRQSNVISDSHEESQACTISEGALKSIYAMAFLRFVKGFVDRDVSRAARRTGLSKMKATTTDDDDDEEELMSDRETTSVPVIKAQGESSMYAHAALIGMPSQFVDLRHRCVHGVVPDLQELRRMSRQALEWLWERWWTGNAEGDAGRWKWEMEERENRTKRKIDEVIVAGVEEAGDAL